MEYIRTGNLVKGFFSAKRDIVVPLIISVVVHGLIIYFIFAGGPNVPGQNGKLYAGKKLTMAEDFVVGQSNLLLGRLSDRLSKIRNSSKGDAALEWSLDSMPVKITSASKVAGLKLVKIKLAKLGKKNGEDSYDVNMRVYSTSGRVFDDILLLSHMVGDATLHSKFTTDKLVIYVKDKKASGATRFSVSTREARRFYLRRITPNEFLIDAAVQEVNDW